MFTVNVHLEHDNAFKLLVGRGNTAANLSTDGVTRMVLKYGNDTDKIIDSDVTASAFDWASEGASGYVIIDLKSTSIPVGIHEARLIIYDTTRTDGQVFGPFRIVVRAKETA